MLKNLPIAWLISLPLSQLPAQAPDISGVTLVTDQVEQYGKFEAGVQLVAGYSNPYNYDEIRVEGIFTAPDGTVTMADGFFMQDYEFTNLQTGAIAPVGNGAFKIRFSPRQTGVWTCVVRCINTAGSDEAAPVSFTCIAPASPENKGFVQTGAGNYLRFSNGDDYIPVGENICWPVSNAYVDYSNWLQQLKLYKGNFFRLWHCAWGLGVEWKNDGTYAGLRRYQQRNAFYQDWLFDYCSDNGIYLMLCLQHHGQVSTLVNPNWNDSPYNADNGGPCNNTWDFFTNTAAKNHVKNRLRYIIARWGYARSIMAWELFNEVDWTDQYEIRKTDVADWHAEMSAFIESQDPFQHLVSTSFAQDYYDPEVWGQTGMDFTQTHYYVTTPNLERVLSQGVRQYLGNFGKPSLNAEFGLNPAGIDLSGVDPDGIHIHNCLWGSLFGGGMGTAMSWWWDSYIDPQNLYGHFNGPGMVAPQIPFSTDVMTPETGASVSGAPGDLTLSTALGWGELADTSFTIGAAGQVSPAGASLAYFLYGSSWNTQYRRPPAFYVDYPQSGTFSIKTGPITGQAPKLAVWLDGFKIWEQNAATDQLYNLNIPAGQHQIRIDNTGTDWISIAYYSFSELGSAVDAYVLVGAERNSAAGWVLNNNYNHDFIQSGGLPAAAATAVVHINNMENGDYLVRYYDCLTGTVFSTSNTTVSDSTLAVELPEFLWDAAFQIERISVSVEEPEMAAGFTLYPNPATGNTVHALFSLETNEQLQFELLDASGRLVSVLLRQPTGAGAQDFALPLPATLPAGVYWVKMSGTRLALARPLLIARH